MVGLEATSAMRDGIHTTLPLPATWKRALLVLDNDADSLQERATRLGHALLTDVKKELDPDAIRRMVTRACAKQPSLFPPDAQTLWEMCVGERPAAPLETQWLRHADRSAAGGGATRTDLCRGLMDALSERLQAREVDMLRHLAQLSPRDMCRIRESFEDAMRSVPIGRYADELLEGHLPASDAPPELDFDEALPLGPKAS